MQKDFYSNSTRNELYRTIGMLLIVRIHKSKNIQRENVAKHLADAATIFSIYRDPFFGLELSTCMEFPCKPAGLPPEGSFG